MKRYTETHKHYTQDFVAKEWDELTAEQQKEVIEYACDDDSFLEFYYMDEEGIFESELQILKDEYKDYIDDISVPWEESSHGPYTRGKWVIEPHGFISESFEFPELGFPSVRIRIEKIDTYGDEVANDTFDLSFYDKINNRYIGDWDITDAMTESPKVQKMLTHYSELYTKIIGEYWDKVREYCMGYETAEEFFAEFFPYQDYKYIFEVNEDGDEDFDSIE